jgi:hypothetical protein
MLRKSKKHLLILISISLLLTTFPTLSNAASLSCTKIGQIKLINKISNTCTLVGSKKVWQKTPVKTLQFVAGVRISAHPNEYKLIPDLNPTSAPTDLDSPIAESARVDLKDMMIEKSTLTPNIEWIIDKNVDPEKLDQYKKRLPIRCNF